MKKLASFIFVVLFSFVSMSTLAATGTHGSHHKASQQNASGNVDLYFFYSRDCSHCVAAHPFIDKLKAQYPWLRVHAFEASGDSKNSRLFEKMAKQHGREPGFFPTFFICDKMIVGYTSADTTGEEIKDAINECHNKN
jgi:thiol-disulfide isomerase/thioredoxin